jgi:8-oxo-dGTP pyrophosphatase MutT (NUDIX family)
MPARPGRPDRAHQLRRPPLGEIAFPGGGAEPGDANLVETALREAAEEIGLEPAAIGLRVIGELEPFWIPVSNFRVTPGARPRGPAAAWTPDPARSSGSSTRPGRVPAGRPIETFERDVRDWRIRYGAYALEDIGDGPAIWGATARILGQLGALLTG